MPLNSAAPTFSILCGAGSSNFVAKMFGRSVSGSEGAVESFSAGLEPPAGLVDAFAGTTRLTFVAGVGEFSSDGVCPVAQVVPTPATQTIVGIARRTTERKVAIVCIACSSLNTVDDGESNRLNQNSKPARTGALAAKDSDLPRQGLGGFPTLAPQGRK
jgi:hypothetical protein